MRRHLLAALVLLAAALACPVPARAHRLDEYLQASRLSVGRDRVSIDLDLTPGAGMASIVVKWMDTDGDGLISAREEDHYAGAVIAALNLSVDGTPAPIRLVDARFPDAADFGRGVGMIRLRAEAATALAASGRHTLSYTNAHRPETSVYLVNALVSEDPSLVIARQERDSAQHRLTLDYAVTSPGWTGWDAAALAIVAAVLAARWAAAS
jgi:hypothetical protein